MLLKPVKVVAVLVCFLGAIAICLAQAGRPASVRSPALGGRRCGRTTDAAGPFPMDLAFSRRPFTDDEKAAVSPTGKSLAYAVDHADEGARRPVDAPVGTAAAILGTRLHVAEVATGKSVPLGAEGADELRPGLVAGRHEARLLLRRGGIPPRLDLRRGPGKGRGRGGRADQGPPPNHDRDAPDVESRRPALPRAGPAGGRGRRRPEAAPGQARGRQAATAARAGRPRPHAAQSRPRPLRTGRRRTATTSRTST